MAAEEAAMQSFLLKESRLLFWNFCLQSVDFLGTPAGNGEGEVAAPELETIENCTDGLQSVWVMQFIVSFWKDFLS
jgi:hypothetical protein